MNFFCDGYQYLHASSISETSLSSFRSGSLSNSRSSSIYANVKPSSDRLSAMNQNGLPDPATGIYSAGGSMYSSQVRRVSIFRPVVHLEI